MLLFFFLNPKSSDSPFLPETVSDLLKSHTIISFSVKSWGMFDLRKNSSNYKANVDTIITGLSMTRSRPAARDI